MKRTVAAGLFFSLILLVSCAEKRGHIIREESVRKVVTHRVTEGETWKSIAADFYKEPEMAEALALYNGSEKGDNPRPGSGVRVPLSEEDIDAIEDDLKASRRYNTGLKLVSEGNYAEAIDNFQNALKLDRSLYDASFNLGVTYQRLGLHKNAVTVLRDLTVRVKDNPEYLFALGNSLFHIGEIQDAKETFRRVLDIDSSHLKSIYSLAIICEKEGDKDKAEEMWKRYLELDSSSDWADNARSHLDAIRQPEGEGN